MRPDLLRKVLRDLIALNEEQKTRVTGELGKSYLAGKLDAYKLIQEMMEK